MRTSRTLTAALALAFFLAAPLYLRPARASAAAPPRSEDVKVTLKASGFEPGEVMREAGTFRLTVANASGVEGLTYRVLKATGEEVFRSPQTSGAADWSGELNLPAGRYVFAVVNHPDWALNLNML